MINQPISGHNNTYSDFNGYMKNPQFIMTKIPDTKEPEEKRGHKTAISVGLGALVVGFGLLGFIKTPHKKLVKPLEKLKVYLEDSLERTKNNKSLAKITETYTFLLKKVECLIQRSESVNNFTSVKDASLKYIMDKTPFTQKIHRGITKLFTKVSRSTVRNSWANTHHKFTKTFDALEGIDSRIAGKNLNEIIEINGVSKSRKAWLETLKDVRGSIKQTLLENSSPETLDYREKIMTGATANLDKLITASMKNFRNGRLVKEFVADSFIVKYKERLFNDMLKFRRNISMNSSDRRNFAQSCVKKAEELLLNGNTNLHLDVISIKNAIKNNAPEKEILAALDKLSTAITKTNTTGKNDAKLYNQTQKYLAQAKEILQDKSTGKMQEMLTIYKKIAPEEYEKALKEMNFSVKALDKSIEIEGKQYFEKLRDLQIGSAPTDVMSVIGSGAYITYALNDTKEKNEKISIMLKEGIPVLSAIGVSLLCTAKLISGGKAMATGLISGWVMRKVGIFVDGALQKHLQNDDGSTTPKAV